MDSAPTMPRDRATLLLMMLMIMVVMMVMEPMATLNRRL